MSATKQDQDMVVQITNNCDDIDVNPLKLKKLVKAVCSRFKLSKVTVSIAVVGHAEMRRLNEQFFNRKYSTDCLSFDLSDDDKGATSDSSAAVRNRKSKIKNRKFFEVVVNAEKAAREARLRGHSDEAELALYVTHGLLHNLGFDDSKGAGAVEMHRTEDEILEQLGYGLVYDKRADS
ncbi:MAG: rRNA maturation RNase YbeY [Planctomycetota bacterium]|jgi:probable rRNA maturation factor